MLHAGDAKRGKTSASESSLNRAAVGWAVSCSAFGLFMFFRFVGNYIQTSADDLPLG